MLPGPAAKKSFTKNNNKRANDEKVNQQDKATTDDEDVKKIFIYIGKLPQDKIISSKEIRAHFEQFGEVVNVFPKGQNTSASIEFASENAAKALIRKGTTSIGERVIQVKKFIPWAGRGGRPGPY